MKDFVLFYRMMPRSKVQNNFGDICKLRVKLAKMTKKSLKSLSNLFTFCSCCVIIKNAIGEYTILSHRNTGVL